MDEEPLKRLIVQVILGLDCLHKINVTHRDLKPQNILIFEDGRVKLSDFGLSKRINSTLSKLKTMSGYGTLGFMAPEISGTVRGAKPQPFKTDIYSLGLTFYYMMTMQFVDSEDLFRKTIPFPEGYSQCLIDFVYFLLKRQPSERPNIDEVL